MKISEFLSERQMSQAEFGRLVGVTQGRVSQWIAGEPVPPARWRKIEEVTQGLVTRNDLFIDPPAERTQEQEPKVA